MWNSVTAVDPPSLTSVEVHPFDVEEARWFLAAASGDRFHARWLIGVSLGLRQGRCWGLPGGMLILINAFLLCGRRCRTGRAKASTSCRQGQQDRGGSFRSRLRWSMP